MLVSLVTGSRLQISGLMPEARLAVGKVQASEQVSEPAQSAQPLPPGISRSPKLLVNCRFKGKGRRAT